MKTTNLSNRSRQGHQTLQNPPPSETTENKQGFELLHKNLQRALQHKGYKKPTPIQEQCIPHLLKGLDLVGIAQTGTGKTAAFTLPILNQLISQPRQKAGQPKTLILAPTRELASQIGDNIREYATYTNLRQLVIFGGVSQHQQVRSLRAGIEILVATPGRLLDLLDQKHLNLSQVNMLVLDEADRMLDMGFIPDIRKILSYLPRKRQTMLFSATLSPKIRSLAETMVHQPVQVRIEQEKPAVDRIDQKILFVGKNNKKSLLLNQLQQPEINKAIVFTQMKHVANQVAKKLSDAGIKSTAIHGNKTQAARTKALHGFKNGQFKVMVATDVAARGIDVQDITHVINYDLPTEAETYIHRIGRTARAGADGSSISFCSAEERAYLHEIEKLMGKPVPADLEHAFHCSQAQNSTQAPPVQGGGRQRKASSGFRGKKSYGRTNRPR